MTSAVVIIGIIGAAVLIGSYLAGRYLGRDGVRGAGKGGEATDSCAAGCEQVQIQKSELCSAKAQTKNLQDALGTARDNYNSILTTIGLTAALLAAAVLSSLVPFVGGEFMPVVAGLTIILAAQTLQAGYAKGKLDRLESQVEEALAVQTDAERFVQQAIIQMRSNCSAAEADACLTRPAPC